MKVAILGFNNLKYSPYIKTYTNLLDKHNIQYDVIIPNRNQFTETINGNLVSIDWNIKKNKLQNFFIFTKKAKAILKKEDYDFVFVLTTLPAILLSQILVKKYKRRYLVDIRDYTYDNVLLFKNIEAYVLKHAHTRVISSPAFRDFLPDMEYVLCHNFSDMTVNTDVKFEKHINPIKIGYVGSINYIEECKRMINLVKNDDRFCFYLYGNEVNSTIVSDYASDIDTDRIQCFGGYEPSEKEQIISNIDILFNDYGNGSDLVRCALSNKLYDSFFYKKPLITSPSTIMSKLASEYSFDIDSETENLDDLYNWYTNIDDKKMVYYMNHCLSQFINENLLFEYKIQEIIGGAL